MNTFNLAVQLGVQKGMPPAIVMCSFTVPDNISQGEVPEAFHAAFVSAIELGKRTGRTNGLDVVSMAMKAVNEHFGGTSFLMMADAVMIIDGFRG